jgi:flagellar protein FlbD
MIFLKKMDNSEFFLNPNLIEQVQCTPDRVVTLTNGKKFIIKDTLSDILDKILDYANAVHNLEYKEQYLKKIENLVN